jgi:hypothetical protein
VTFESTLDDLLFAASTLRIEIYYVKRLIKTISHVPDAVLASWPVKVAVLGQVSLFDAYRCVPFLALARRAVIPGAK